MVKGKPIILLCLAGLLLSSCHVGRYFWWNYADYTDYRKFPSIPIRTSDPSSPFYKSAAPGMLRLPEGYGQAQPSLSDWLQEKKTAVFLVIRRDTVLYEHYAAGFDSASILSSFSIAKSFVSALVGIALGEGAIHSIKDPVTMYLPELNRDGIDMITLEHLMDMQSGLKFHEGYSTPFSLMSRYYYGTRLKKYLSRLQVKEEPGKRYEYQSVNTLLLGLALERATGMTLAGYLESRLWQPMGMESDASWSIDSRKDSTVKSFCCLNARAMDLARFGRLYLHHGNWNGTQLIPESWVLLTLNNAGSLPDDAGYPYHLHWRVTCDGNLFAKGVLGQYLYLDYKKQVIIVRLGTRPGGVDWPAFFKQLCNGL